MILKRASSKERNGAEYFYKDFDTESRSTEVASVRIKDCLLESAIIKYYSSEAERRGIGTSTRLRLNFHDSIPILLDEYYILRCNLQSTIFDIYVVSLFGNYLYIYFCS